MYTKSLLVASLAVSAATATHIYPAHNRLRRDLVQARQTDAGGADSSAVMSAAQACLTDLASAYASMPTPPPEVVAWEQTVVVTDPCAFTIPQSISSAVVEYESEVEDWYSSNSAAIASAISECPTYSTYGNYGGGDGYSSYGDYCSTAAGGSGSGSGSDSTAGGSDATATGGSDTTATGGSKTTATNGSGGSKTTATNNGGSGTTATTAATTNAGPKETAVLGAAALAVAGVLGVVAAL